MTQIKTEAQCFHDKLKHELWTQKKLKSIPNKTWIDAVVRWLDESQHKRSLKTDKYHLAWLDPYLRKYKVKDIHRDLIESIAKDKERTGVSLATFNCVLELLRAKFNKAHTEWGWLQTVPLIRMRKIENKRIRWLTKTEARRLLRELPPHLKSIAIFTLDTGLRLSNVSGLRWSQVDLEKRHALNHPDESKSKRAIPVPLNKQAIDKIANR